MDPWLRTQAIPAHDLIFLFLEPQSGSQQPSVTLAPRDMIPLISLDTCTHVHIAKHRPMHTIKNSKSIFKHSR